MFSESRMNWGVLVVLVLALGCVARPEDEDALSLGDGLSDDESDLGRVGAGDEMDADLGAGFAAADTGGVSCSVDIKPAQELMIRSLAVVNDPVRTVWSGANRPGSANGAWHFGRLMDSMAEGNDAAGFVRSWLGQWETDQQVNGFTVPSRTAIRELVIDPWPKRRDGQLDLTRAPMRLLAIVNRVDLGDGNGRCGEGRFVFGVLGPSREALSFTVILEYGLPGSTPSECLQWAIDWHALGALRLGSARYNTA